MGPLCWRLDPKKTHLCWQVAAASPARRIAAALDAQLLHVSPSTGWSLWGRGATPERRGLSSVAPRRRLDEQRSPRLLGTTTPLLSRPVVSPLVPRARSAAPSTGRPLGGWLTSLGRRGPVAVPPRRCPDEQRSTPPLGVDAALLLRPSASPLVPRARNAAPSTRRPLGGVEGVVGAPGASCDAAPAMPGQAEVAPAARGRRRPSATSDRLSARPTSPGRGAFDGTASRETGGAIGAPRVGRDAAPLLPGRAEVAPALPGRAEVALAAQTINLPRDREGYGKIQNYILMKSSCQGASTGVGKFSCFLFWRVIPKKNRQKHALTLFPRTVGCRSSKTLIRWSQMLLRCPSLVET